MSAEQHQQQQQESQRSPLRNMDVDDAAAQAAAAAAAAAAANGNNNPPSNETAPAAQAQPNPMAVPTIPAGSFDQHFHVLTGKVNAVGMGVSRLSETQQAMGSMLNTSVMGALNNVQQQAAMINTSQGTMGSHLNAISSNQNVHSNQLANLEGLVQQALQKLDTLGAGYNPGPGPSNPRRGNGFKRPKHDDDAAYEAALKKKGWCTLCDAAGNKRKWPACTQHNREADQGRE
ncbi:hypothetical protein HYH03_010548 [Edaphochlamys debaryana]|uniref:Uncharacterized protein n=1 Tax=Edaphochlamys debaryana TaxID=47281 RepID=A0A835Y4X6_9CHLO|nr:hypothetical protein HYH03_010548 [Edaphochlamys debaryana]|eukprot:KAG2491104.1 hypothetical protein HYH03_010548 [Edaphochlamys debaryana]